jgi:uncharacterized membrane protein
VISPIALELILVALALAAALAVRPWRLLRPQDGQVRLATPLLACLTMLPWLWSWPGLSALSLPVHWSGAPLAVLLIGWPLAIPIVVLAGLSTMLTTGADFAEAVSLTVWSGVLPATMVLVLGHGVRKAFGTHPIAYMVGRAFFVPMVTLAVCSLVAAFLGNSFVSTTVELQRVAIGLLAMGEASWTCAIVSLLVAYKPQWLATWSETAYLGRPVRGKAVTKPRR